MDAPHTLCTHAEVKMTMEKRSNKCWRSVSIYFGSQMHTYLFIQEMRYITKRMRDKDEEDVVINDWKFAAMVIDRWSRADKFWQIHNNIFPPDFVCLASLSIQFSQRSYFSHLRLTLWSPKEVVQRFNHKNNAKSEFRDRVQLRQVSRLTLESHFPGGWVEDPG